MSQAVPVDPELPLLDSPSLPELVLAPELVDDPRYATLADRAEHSDEINDLVAAWTSSLPTSEVEYRCIAEEVPVADYLALARLKQA